MFYKQKQLIFTASALFLLFCFRFLCASKKKKNLIYAVVVVVAIVIILFLNFFFFVNIVKENTIDQVYEKYWCGFKWTRVTRLAN